MPDDRAPDHNALTEAVPTLPAAWYYDTDHHLREMRAIWQKGWVYAGRAAALAKPAGFDRRVVLIRRIPFVRPGNRSGAKLLSRQAPGAARPRRLPV